MEMELLPSSFFLCHASEGEQYECHPVSPLLKDSSFLFLKENPKINLKSSDENTLIFTFIFCCNI